MSTIPNSNLVPDDFGIVMSHIGWRGEQNTIHEDVETFL